MKTQQLFLARAPVAWLLLACAALVLAGCRTKPVTAALLPEPVEIRYWTGWSGYELRTQKEIIKEFERLHPHIRVLITGNANRLAMEEDAYAIQIFIEDNAMPQQRGIGRQELLKMYLRDGGDHQGVARIEAAVKNRSAMISRLSQVFP